MECGEVKQLYVCNCVCSKDGSVADDQDHCDTVGAVAVDACGNFAYATSTGGITAKQPGRVGDSPVPGNCQTVVMLL